MGRKVIAPLVNYDDIGPYNGDNDNELTTLIAKAPPRRRKLSIMIKIKNMFREKHYSRSIYLNSHSMPPAFTKNVIRNQKYNVFTFLPIALYNQFKIFLNTYFLGVALSQFVPALKIGFLFTYVAPLVFVLSVTLLKEAYDDINRWRRDKELNSEEYLILTEKGLQPITSAEIRVGDMICVKTNQRVPADLVLLRTTEKGGSSFFRTDQLDGETDWKSRRAVNATQKLSSEEDLLRYKAVFFAEEPRKELYDFVGTFTTFTRQGEAVCEPLNLENAVWANTVCASGIIMGLVIYSGRETRATMNQSLPRSKIGKLDRELNRLTEFLFMFLVAISVAEALLQGINKLTPLFFFRFVLLFSAIIPISMRVNLDMAKTVYSVFVMGDRKIPGTVVRNSTLPEELGRIEYLFSDKTGTLTKNEMVFKKVHVGDNCFTDEGSGEIRQLLVSSYSSGGGAGGAAPSNVRTAGAVAVKRVNWNTKVRNVVTAMALCHNVTPVSGDGSDGGEEDEEGRGKGSGSAGKRNRSLLASVGRMTVKTVGAPVALLTGGLFGAAASGEGDDAAAGGESAGGQAGSGKQFQASSPDEVALVRFADKVGMELDRRDNTSIRLKNPVGGVEEYEILNTFPFTSETKRMGIIVRNQSGVISFFVKGADAVMTEIVRASDWLEEECDNMAREGLRTLVFGKKIISQAEYDSFVAKYKKASATTIKRRENMHKCVQSLEKNLQLIGLTGVEDCLQDDVRSTLEMLSNAKIRVWMLTGDKVETAMCIARSTRLVSRNQQFFRLIASRKPEIVQLIRQMKRHSGRCLVVDGSTLGKILASHRSEPEFQNKSMREQFVIYAKAMPAVVCCRCSPTQKAEVVTLVKKVTNRRCAAIGDGGNDVSMITAADVGIGLKGKEGKQASLAADFSIDHFKFLARLVFWHGRNSYKRSARLAQFVMHRGLVISVIQAVFSAFFYFAPIAIYNGWLLVGYSTFYTMLPVFALILDEDVPENLVFVYPELYIDLQKGRSLSFKTFASWMFISLYQGGTIMIGTMILFESNFYAIVTITFTALILSEYINIAADIHRWHKFMWYAEAISVLVYLGSGYLFRDTFDWTFVTSWRFARKVLMITLCSTLPLTIWKRVTMKCWAPSYTKIKL